MSKKKTNIYLQRLNSFSKEVDYKYNCISLFSGGGGLDLGAHFAGFKTLLVSDIIAAYTETIKANLPHVSVYNDDAMDLTAEKIRGLANVEGDVDLIIAGPPCQAFSIMGKRQSLDDPRGKLTIKYFELVSGLRPKVFMFENVPGLMTVNHGEDFSNLLEFIENGKITLIASTTENPSLYVFNAILSRSTIFEFKQISADAAQKAVRRAISFLEKRGDLSADIEDGVIQYIAGACGGDLRKAYNAVEVLFSASRTENGTIHLSLDDARIVAQKSAMRADREGDNFYDLLSSLQKSIRGSDPDAAVYYLAWLLDAGQIQAACRRLMVIAAEDIGLAFPHILPIVKSCIDAALMLGMPEARIPLADAAILMATSPKSNSGYNAIDAAMNDIQNGKIGDFPRHLQNVHADTYTMEREQNYMYPHNFPNHWVKQQYLPDCVAGTSYYCFGDNRTEQAARQYWEKIKMTGENDENCSQ